MLRGGWGDVVFLFDVDDMLLDRALLDNMLLDSTLLDSTLLDNDRSSAEVDTRPTLRTAAQELP